MVRSCLEGWNRGDFEAYSRPFHRQAEYFSAIAGLAEGDELAWRGPAERRRFWDEWHSLWDLTIEVSEVRERGDMLVALGGITTRGKASGVELQSSIAFVFEFDEGLVRKVRAYLDHSDALKAAGLEK
jgi:ketosteroid isomerase-like protein